MTPSLDDCGTNHQVLGELSTRRDRDGVLEGMAE